MTSEPKRPACYPRIGYRTLGTAIRNRKYLNRQLTCSHDIQHCPDCGKYHLTAIPMKGTNHNGPEN